ncbi:unnamed protein product, partial [Cuscuta epithymum]
MPHWNPCFFICFDKCRRDKSTPEVQGLVLAGLTLAGYQPRFPQLRDELKYTELLQKNMGTFYYPDEGVLAEAGVRTEVMQLLGRGWWRHLFFGIRDPTFREITCEVLATFRTPKVLAPEDNHWPVIKFRAFEENHSITISEMEYHLGFTRIEDNGQHEA